MSHPKTILATALTSRKLAVAIFFEERLIYYQSSSLASKEKCPADVAARNIENLIRAYNAKSLAIEELVYKQQQIPTVTTLRQKTIKVSRKYGLTVRSYTPSEVRSSLCRDSKSTNTALARVLVSHYPELKKFWRNQTEHQSAYRQLLFKAIAIGLCCAKDVTQI
jgi:Holliday junction resolvasome RuvABC endonuclease subunit